MSFFRTEGLLLTSTAGLYATVGCHPTRSKQFDDFKGGPDAYLQALDALIEENLTGIGRVVAVGECGLGTTTPAEQTRFYLTGFQIMIEPTSLLPRLRKNIFVSPNNTAQQMVNLIWHRFTTGVGEKIPSPSIPPFTCGSRRLCSDS